MAPNDTVNRSGLFLMLARDGRIVAGEDHPDARMVLAAPGGVVPGDYVRKYGLESLLMPGVSLADDRKDEAAGKPEPTPPVKAMPAPAANKAMAPASDKMMRGPGSTKGQGRR